MPNQAGQAATLATPATSFVDQIRISREPRDLLGRLFLAAETAALHAGITIRLAAFAELVAVFEQHRTTWKGLAPMFDVREGPIHPDDAACFIGSDAHGEPVTTGAVRRFDLTGRTLRDGLESLDVWYGVDAAAQRAHSQCRITAPIAETLTGLAMCRGGYWVRPDFRGTGLAKILSPLVRYYGMSQWDIDFEFMVGSKAFLQPAIRDMYQCQSVQENFSFRRHGVTLMEGPLIWSDAAFILDRLGGAVVDFGGIGSSEVRARRHYVPFAATGRNGNE